MIILYLKMYYLINYNIVFFSSMIGQLLSHDPDINSVIDLTMLKIEKSYTSLY